MPDATSQLTLIQEVTSIKTLREAWRTLRKTNKRSHGLTGETIQQFGDNLDGNLQSIHDKLKMGTYKFSPFRPVAIEKPATSGQEHPEYRPIKIPEVKDRVVLKATANVIGETLQTHFKLDNEASFAYLKKYGVEDAIRRMARLYHEGKKVILEADIEKFFDSVNMDTLVKQKVFPALRDDSLNDLILAGLQQEIGYETDLTDYQLAAFEKTKGGIPQGSALSPLLSNICLSDFDQRMISEGFGLIRYADDFIVMCENEEQAAHAFVIAKDEIQNKLGLKLYDFDSQKKPARIVRPDREKFSFLSIQFRGHELYPNPEKVKELKEKIRKVCVTKRWNAEAKQLVDNDVLTVLRKTNNLLCGWLASFSYSDIDRYFDDVDEYVYKELENVLRKMGWTFKSKSVAQTKKKYATYGHVSCLSEEQRKFSGVCTCQSIFKEVMTNREKIKLNA